MKEIAIASYRPQKRRNCFKKVYYKITWVLDSDFAKFKRENENDKNE